MADSVQPEDGFDVFSGVDTKYLKAQTTDRKKRDAVGPYAQSG